MDLKELNYLKQLVENETLTHAQKAERMSEKFSKHFNKDTIGANVAKRLKSGEWCKFVDKITKSTEIKADGSQTSTIKIKMTESQSKDPDYVLKAHGYEPEHWQIVNLTSNIWEQNNSEKGLVQLYQSKIIVKPKTHEDVEDIIEALVAKVEPVTFAIKRDPSAANTLVVNIADTHMGIMTIEDMSGVRDEIIARISKGYKKVVFNIIGDVLHNDSLVSPTTTRGTLVDQVDMVQAIEDLKAYIEPMIEAAYKISLVEVYYIPGNHDLTVSYMFMQYLLAKFSGTDIYFDAELKHRKAYMIDNVLVGIAHGDVSRRNLPMLLATEFPELWGIASTREYFVGHFHHEKKEVTVPVEDKNGVTIRQLATVKKSDYYEIKNGYTASRKKLQLFVFDENELRVTYEL